jgi:hypothetical protein
MRNQHTRLFWKMLLSEVDLTRIIGKKYLKFGRMEHLRGKSYELETVLDVTL